MKLPIHHNKSNEINCPLCDAGLQPKYPIMSYWQTETGRWDEEKETFTNLKFSEIKEKIIQVEYQPEKDVIQFLGGPTGYESYYFADIYKSIHKWKSEKLYICAGTLNSWSSCYVKISDLLDIMNSIKRNKNNE